MAKSILQEEKVCYVTGRTDCLEKHHIFGASNRKNSEKYGLYVYLTHDYHNEPPRGVHFDRRFNVKLKQKAQRTFEKSGTRAEFMSIFGRNWL